MGEVQGMLPFLKLTKEGGSASTAVVKRDPDEESEYDALESAADDLMAAIERKDTKGVAAALRAAFDLCDSEPHAEGPHVGD
jgi:hypothetical protein